MKPGQGFQDTINFMERIVESEWLDELAVDDDRAVRSRRDLVRLNCLIGHARIMSGLLARTRKGGSECHLVELGAGDGTFALRWTGRLPPQTRPARVTLVDRLPSISEETRQEFAERGCTVNVVQADVFDWLPGGERATVISANLFLHHFAENNLARLLDGIARSSEAFIACEPRRGSFTLAASRLVRLIGCNDVTRHDAVVSVRAGFAGTELSRLWPAGDQWAVSERRAGLFSHAFVASKVDCQ